MGRRYRARLVLEAAPAEVWALRIDRLSTRADVRVNGALVHGTLAAGLNALRRPVPALVALPPTLLHAGENLLEIDVDHGVRGGLSPLLSARWSSSKAPLPPGYHSASTSRALNIVSAGACLVALLVWWRRRSEVALGSFCARSGCWPRCMTSPTRRSARRCRSSWPTGCSSPPRSPSVVLVGLFALAVAGRFDSRWRSVWLVGGAVMTA